VLSLLSGVVFTQDLPKRRDSVAQARQVCVFTDGAVDRSPSGTALSGKLALMHARGEIDLGDSYVVEGLLGGTFTGRPARAGIAVGPHQAIIAEIEGSATITGQHCFFIDPADSLGEGFLL
jgi:proline racemase